MSDGFPIKYGVAVDEELQQRIERHLSNGDSRSARVRGLIRLGLVFEDEMLRQQYWPPDQEERERMLSEAMQKYIDEEFQ